MLGTVASMMAHCPFVVRKGPIVLVFAEDGCFTNARYVDDIMLYAKFLFEFTRVLDSLTEELAKVVFSTHALSAHGCRTLLLKPAGGGRGR